MENASKALLIAGGVLIAIIILTIGVTLYTMYSKQSKEYNEIFSATEISKFNSKFEVYIGRTDITAQEIVTVVNLAKQYNNTVKIKVDSTILQFNKTNTPENFIMENLNNTFSFVNGTNDNPNPTYDETGKITGIKLKKNS